MTDLFGNPVRVRKARKPRPEPTREHIEILRCALAKGVVRRRSRGARTHDETFQRPKAVDRCIALGWLAPGEAFNAYHATATGRDVVA